MNPLAIPSSLRREMAEIGLISAQDVPKHVKSMIDGFSELLATAPKSAMVTRDIAYGPHARQRLDVFMPPSSEHRAAH